VALGTFLAHDPLVIPQFDKEAAGCAACRIAERQIHFAGKNHPFIMYTHYSLSKDIINVRFTVIGCAARIGNRHRGIGKKTPSA